MNWHSARLRLEISTNSGICSWHRLMQSKTPKATPCILQSQSILNPGAQEIRNPSSEIHSHGVPPQVRSTMFNILKPARPLVPVISKKHSSLSRIPAAARRRGRDNNQNPVKSININGRKTNPKRAGLSGRLQKTRMTFTCKGSEGGDVDLAVSLIFSPLLTPGPSPRP